MPGTQKVLKGESQIHGKVRLRACGICIDNERIMLVKHLNLGPNGFFWSPPGGEVEFGETLAQAVEREFNEECCMQIKAGRLLFVSEFIKAPLHAIELFLEVQHISGMPMLGTDPHSTHRSIQLVDIGWWSLEDMHKEGIENFHAAFQKISSLHHLLQPMS